jgi:hypothetical protein
VSSEFAEVASDERIATAAAALERNDRMEGPPRVRALVIAVLDDQAAGG